MNKGFLPPETAKLLKCPELLEEYWQQGNDLCDEDELALFSLPNKEKLIGLYISYGHGLCAKAQKKLFTLPQDQSSKLIACFIGGINEKNYSERMLCNNIFFFLLKNKPLFDLYVEKMSPFYEEKKYIFPQSIAFVAKRKGWL